MKNIGNTKIFHLVFLLSLTVTSTISGCQSKEIYLLQNGEITKERYRSTTDRVKKDVYFNEKGEKILVLKYRESSRNSPEKENTNSGSDGEFEDFNPVGSEFGNVDFNQKGTGFALSEIYKIVLYKRGKRQKVIYPKSPKDIPGAALRLIFK